MIGGTFYAGEIKKSIFTVMNDRLPLEGVFPMHCSANVGPDGDVAIFFGLSGTGKTTLSADPARSLIGDDEHGWGSNGVFNVEGGCYAKVIRLSAEAEPEIHRTTHLRDDPRERDGRRAGPRRSRRRLEDREHWAAYELEQIPNAHPSKMAGHPRNVVFLTADAFGALPPLARLSPGRGSTGSSRDSRRSWRGRRSASPSRSRPSRRASGSRSSRSCRPSTRACSPTGSTGRPSGS